MIYKYVAIAIAALALCAGLYFVGSHNGSKRVALKLAQEQIKYQEKITKATIELQAKEKKLEEQRRINKEVIANAKDPTGCADTVMPDALSNVLR